MRMHPYLRARTPNDKLCHVPKMTRPVPFRVHRYHNGVLSFLLALGRQLRRRYARQRIPRRREIGKIEAERFRLYASLDSSSVKLPEKATRFGQRPRTHAGHRGRTGKASGGLLKQHDIALFRLCPHRGYEPSTWL